LVYEGIFATGTVSINFSLQGSTPHAMYTSSTTTAWYHAVGDWFEMWVVGVDSTGMAGMEVTWWNTFTVPVRNPGGLMTYVNGAGKAWSCMTSAFNALIHCL
jgi:hypothetical protein